MSVSSIMSHLPYLAIALLAVAWTAPVGAQTAAPAYPRMTIEQASQQRNETTMSIEGTFLRQHRGEEDEFIFRDLAGDEIRVYDRQAGRDVRLNVPVVIEGAIDRGIPLRVEFNLHRVVAAPTGAAAQPAPSEARDGIFIHLSSGHDTPRPVLMALTLAAAYAGDHPVLIYADLDAVRLFVQASPATTSPGFQPAAERIPELLQRGVRIRVCPTCLAAAGLTSADLIGGVALADKREFLAFTSGRILTFDY